MEDFQSETDSDYTSYWRDWVGPAPSFSGEPPSLPSYRPDFVQPKGRKLFFLLYSGHQSPENPASLWQSIVVWSWEIPRFGS